MVSRPFNPAETLPDDNGVAAQFPNQERAFRDIMESWMLANHDRNGNHSIVGLVDVGGVSPTGETGVVTIWEDGGLIYARKDMDTAQRIVTTPSGATIPNSSLDPMAESTVKGRAAGGGTGAPQDLSSVDLTTIIGTFTADNGVIVGVKGLVPAPAIGDLAAAKTLGIAGWGFSGAPHAVIQDIKTSGTDGGTFTSGAWQNRNLTTKVYDLTGAVSIASNILTLLAGTYIVRWSAPAYRCSQHQTRLLNVTDTISVYGASSHSENSSGGTARSEGIAKFTIAGTKTFRLQHQCASTRATDGFGIASGFTSNEEVYSIIEIWKQG